jgi:hypothetical protein
MSDEKNPTQPTERSSRIATPRITRRRFTKAGAVAPVVMTLASRPVWGQTCSFSGQLSGNEYATAAPAGVGFPPSHYWNAETSELKNVPEGLNPQPTKDTPILEVIAQVEPGVVGFDCYFVDMTFSVLEGGDLAAHAAAAVLNIAAGGYGYEMHGLVGFLCKVGVAHPEDALAVLQVLNSEARVCV